MFSLYGVSRRCQSEKRGVDPSFYSAITPPVVSDPLKFLVYCLADKAVYAFSFCLCSRFNFAFLPSREPNEHLVVCFRFIFRCCRFLCLWGSYYNLQFCTNFMHVFVCFRSILAFLLPDMFISPILGAHSWRTTSRFRATNELPQIFLCIH